MSLNITGDTINNIVQVNNGDLQITNAANKIIAPRAEITAISGISATTTANVGIANTSPGHHLSVGTKFYVNDDGDDTTPVVKVDGLLEANKINFGGSATDRVFISDSAGALSTSSNITFTDSIATLAISNNFTTATANISGVSNLNSIVAGTATLSGLATMNGGIDVNGVADVSGAATLGSTLSVAGDATFSADANVAGVANANSLEVVGLATMNGGIDVNGTGDISGDLTLGSSLSVAGSANIAVDSNVVGAHHVGGNTILNTLTAGGAATMSSTLGVTGVTTLSDALSVSGLATLNGGVDVNGVADVSGAVTLQSSANIAGAANVNTTLDVTGASTLGSLTVGGTSGFTGQATFNAATGLRVVNDAQVDGNLQVEGNLIVNGDLTVVATQNLTIEDPITLLGNTNSLINADVGHIIKRPTGNSNVATYWDGGLSRYMFCLTDTAGDQTQITPDTAQNIIVDVVGNINAHANVECSNVVTQHITLGSSAITIENNVITFK
jgi:hypothetical protein